LIQTPAFVKPIPVTPSAEMTLPAPGAPMTLPGELSTWTPLPSLPSRASPVASRPM